MLALGKNEEFRKYNLAKIKNEKQVSFIDAKRVSIYFFKNKL